MEATGFRILGLYWGYSPPEVDRIWGIWGSYSNIPKAILYLLKGDYKPKSLEPVKNRTLNPGPGNLTVASADPASC